MDVDDSFDASLDSPPISGDLLRSSTLGADLELEAFKGFRRKWLKRKAERVDVASGHVCSESVGSVVGGSEPQNFNSMGLPVGTILRSKDATDTP